MDGFACVRVAENVATTHPVGGEEQQGAEQAARYHHDCSQWCDVEHATGYAGQEGQQQGGHRLCLLGVLRECVEYTLFL
jgi:hypothetical protein